MTPSTPLHGVTALESSAECLELRRRHIRRETWLTRINPFVFDVPSFVKALVLAFRRPYLSLRYNLVLLLFLTALIGFLLLVRLVQFFDHILYPRYHSQPVKEPIYILANPRSGTTFLHRVMCLDEQFTYFKLWHTIFPSILLIRLIRAIARIDAAVGGPLAKVVDRINRLAFGGWDGVHAVGLDRSEEDEQLWVYTNLTPAVALWFPFLHKLDEVKFVDDLPERVRLRLMHYYRDALKRQLYAVGEGKRLLAKNALAAGRIRTMLGAAPDMKIVYLVRHPYDAIPSLVSMFSMPWRWHSPHIQKDGPEVKAFAQLGIDYYKAMFELKNQLPPEQVVEIRYDDLIADPKGSVQKIYAHFGMEITPQFDAALTAEAAKSRSYSSRHDYSLEEFGLSREWIAKQMPEIFAYYGFSR